MKQWWTASSDADGVMFMNLSMVISVQDAGFDMEQNMLVRISVDGTCAGDHLADDVGVPF